jgi:hypothetical protein
MAFCALSIIAAWKPTELSMLGLAVSVIAFIGVMLRDSFVQIRSETVSVKLLVGIVGALTLCCRPLPGIESLAEELYYYLNPEKLPRSTMSVDWFRERFIETCSFISVVAIAVGAGMFAQVLQKFYSVKKAAEGTRSHLQ